MRKSLMVLGLMLIGAGCGSPAIGELGEDLTVADCQKYLGNGNPFGNCPALDPTKVTAADCKTLDGTTPWNPKWNPTLPICFGLQGDINKYNDPKYVKGAANPPPKNCNYLQLPDPKYNDCANYKYEICSLGNKLPGQSGGDPKGKGRDHPRHRSRPARPARPRRDHAWRDGERGLPLHAVLLELRRRQAGQVLRVQAEDEARLQRLERRLQLHPLGERRRVHGRRRLRPGLRLRRSRAIAASAF